MLKHFICLAILAAGASTLAGCEADAVSDVDDATASHGWGKQHNGGRHHKGEHHDRHRHFGFGKWGCGKWHHGVPEEAVRSVRDACIGAHDTKASCVACVEQASQGAKVRFGLNHQQTVRLALEFKDECKQKCVPNSCENAGYECGALDDGCGNTFECGSCTGDAECVNNACVEGCEPLTCDAVPLPACGNFGDGCGGRIDCACPDGETCSDSTGQCVPRLPLDTRMECYCEERPATRVDLCVNQSPNICFDEDALQAICAEHCPGGGGGTASINCFPADAEHCPGGEATALACRCSDGIIHKIEQCLAPDAIDCDDGPAVSEFCGEVCPSGTNLEATGCLANGCQVP